MVYNLVVDVFRNRSISQGIRTNYPSNTARETVNIWLTIQKMFHFNSVQQGSHSRHTLHAESYNTLTLTQNNIQNAGIEQKNGGDQSTVLKN